jgi:hypothetical protein
MSTLSLSLSISLHVWLLYAYTLVIRGTEWSDKNIVLCYQHWTSPAVWSRIGTSLYAVVFLIVSLGSTQSLTETSTRNFLAVKRGLRVTLTALPQSLSRLSRKCWVLNVSQAYGSPRTVTGIALLLYPLCFALLPFPPQVTLVLPNAALTSGIGICLTSVSFVKLR